MLPEQAQFRTQDPVTLRADLDRAYRELRTALLQLASAIPPTVVYVTGSPWPANIGDCLVIDDDATVTLPILTEIQAGAKVAIIRRGGTVTTRADPFAVQGLTADVESAFSRWEYQWDGQTGWWR